MNRVVKRLDIVIVCGHRPEKEQNEAVANKKSKLKFPNSKHNKIPSEAVDVAFWDGEKLLWDTKQASFMAGYILAVADEMGIEIRLGADWDRDRNITDENFIDLPHLEYING
jgi:hypothetical protein